MTFTMTLPNIQILTQDELYDVEDIMEIDGTILAPVVFRTIQQPDRRDLFRQVQRWLGVRSYVERLVR